MWGYPVTQPASAPIQQPQTPTFGDFQRVDKEMDLLRSAWSVALGSPCTVTVMVEATWVLQPWQRFQVSHQRPSSTRAGRVDSEGPGARQVMMDVQQCRWRMPVPRKTSRQFLPPRPRAVHLQFPQFSRLVGPLLQRQAPQLKDRSIPVEV